MSRPDLARHAPVLVSLCACAALAGCGDGLFTQGRPAAMELGTPQGVWRVEGLSQAMLQRPGWRLVVRDVRISQAEVPVLQAVTFQVINTSELPLYLVPDEFTLAGLTAEPIFLGPPAAGQLAKNESLTITYDPRQAPVTSYPFVITVTVFRSPDYSDPDEVTVRLY